jgi:hypothetical protein
MARRGALVARAVQLRHEDAILICREMVENQYSYSIFCIPGYAGTVVDSTWRLGEGLSNLLKEIIGGKCLPCLVSDPALHASLGRIPHDFLLLG